MKGNVCVCQRKGDCGIVAGSSVFLNFTACNISTKSKHLVRAGYFHFISALTLSLRSVRCSFSCYIFIHSFLSFIYLGAFFFTSLTRPVLHVSSSVSSPSPGWYQSVPSSIGLTSLALLCLCVYVGMHLCVCVCARSRKGLSRSQLILEMHVLLPNMQALAGGLQGQSRVFSTFHKLDEVRSVSAFPLNSCPSYWESWPRQNAC